MRISTLYMFKQSAESMSKRVSENNEVYMKLSSGKTLLRASDDPQGATDAVRYQDALSQLELYSDARSRVRGTLQHEENILNGVSALYATLNEKAVAAKSESSDEARHALGAEIKGIRDNLLDLANNRDSSGRYIFAGYDTDSAAFDASGNYQGGTTVKTLSVAEGSEMPSGHLGDEVFDSIFSIADKAITELNNTPVDEATLKVALQDLMDSLSTGLEKVGKAQAEIGTNLQQLEALDTNGDVLINDTIVKVQNAIGSDYGTMTSLIMDSKMSEFALNASMMVFQSMQKMNLFNR
ncbi:flagellar hook-associated protein FlgL [Pantoea agglomerans]|uniref:flagellar hook-associated protein FlgL n=1 Tax=Enterobacter agglomerans TaxID=549 RepID=UPI0027D82E14|nr:flagellar hook-associated protein FlgL [Pantoea agglomerans]